MSQESGNPFDSPDNEAGYELSAAVDVVASGAAAEAISRFAPEMAEAQLASAISRRNPDLWGPDAHDEAAIRLAWVDLPRSSRELLPAIGKLREEFIEQGLDRFVLCGMGGSSLAPEVITAAAGVPLVCLDSTEPGQVQSALVDLERTVVVVSSKSGSTVETDSHRRVFESAFRDLGIDPAQRIVIVTDPGSPLEASAKQAGYRVFTADPQVGGRFSALTAFGLVPSGLAGADLNMLLDDALLAGDILTDDSAGNPAIMLGAALGATNPLRNKVVFVNNDDWLPGFADWAEQLIAESTGKDGTGLLPVVVAGDESPEVTSGVQDVLVVRLVSDVADSPDEDDPMLDAGDSVTVAGPLGAQFLLWEYATALAGTLLDINPFDQPDVESAKTAARAFLDETPEPTPADLIDGAVEVRASYGLGDEVRTVTDAVAALFELMPADGYLAVMAYLDRHADAALAQIREDLARALGRPVTFGWGPRFLHSTGQFHKGGPAQGIYVQITAQPQEDLPVPDRPFSFGQLIAAQAAGDAQVLADHGRPVLRLHLTDHDAGLKEVRRAFCRNAQ